MTPSAGISAALPRGPHYVLLDDGLDWHYVHVDPVPSFSQAVTHALELASIHPEKNGWEGTNLAELKLPDEDSFRKQVRRWEKPKAVHRPTQRHLLALALVLEEQLLPDFAVKGVIDEAITERRNASYDRQSEKNRTTRAKRKLWTPKTPHIFEDPGRDLPQLRAAYAGSPRCLPGAFFEYLAAGMRIRIGDSLGPWSVSDLEDMLRFRDPSTRETFDLSIYLHPVLSVLHWWNVIVHVIPQPFSGPPRTSEERCDGVWVAARPSEEFGLPAPVFVPTPAFSMPSDVMQRLSTLTPDERRVIREIVGASGSELEDQTPNQSDATRRRVAAIAGEQCTHAFHRKGWLGARLGLT